MQHLGDYRINDYITFGVQLHRFSSGAVYAPTGNVTYTFYEDNSATAPTGGNLAQLDSKTGLYSARVQLTTAASFEAGKEYFIHVQATVDSVAAAELFHFRIIANPNVNVATISNNAITADAINDGAITSGKFASGAINATAIASNAITDAKINNGAITADKIANNAITAAKINDNAITADKISANAIAATKIANNAITADKIADNAITSAKINDNAITAGKINSGAITSAKFAAGAIDATAIATNAIGSDELADAAASKIGTAVWATATRQLTNTQSFNLTGNITGNLSGSVGSVTGAVGSVTGNVGGNVAGSVASVTGAVGSVTGAVGSVTADVTVGTNKDKTGYSLSTSPPTATAIRQEIEGANYMLAAIKGIVDKVDTMLEEGEDEDYVFTEASLVNAPAGGNGGAGFTVQDIVDGILDEALEDHDIAGSVGAGIAAAGSAGDPWATLIPGSYGDGTAGKIVGGYLDAAISTRLATAGYTAPPTPAQIWSADTRQLTSAQSFNLTGNITGNLSGSVGSVTGAVGSVTGAVGSVTGGVTVTTNNDKTGYSLASAPPSATAIREEMDANSTRLSGLVTELGKVPKSDSNVTWNNTALGSIQTKCGDALAAYDPPTNAEMEARTIASANYATASNLSTTDGKIDSIKTKTDSLTFTKSGEVDSNIKSINGTTVTGDGGVTPWGP
jgi:hypothetical protein